MLQSPLGVPAASSNPGAVYRLVVTWQSGIGQQSVRETLVVLHHEKYSSRTSKIVTAVSRTVLRQNIDKLELIHIKKVKIRCNPGDQED